MNVKEYIASGVVESYVLGLATEAEQHAFETACQQYPEVLQARLQFELALEARLVQDAAPLPVELKNKIEASLKELDAPAPQTFSNTHTTPVRRLGVWKLAVAASVAALLGVLIWAVQLNEKN
ncbi:MAG TPA: hypothetical protein VM010_00865, partial [Chitinophagaceae bacterium]|nr:hypothetical protein [Chitinophagaceae bacterium]